MASFCDDRCTNAKGESCDCECGGLNHGSLSKDGGMLRAIDRSDRENPVVMESADIKKELRALKVQEDRLDEFDSPSQESQEEDSIDDRKKVLHEELKRREQGGAQLGSISSGTMRTQDIGPAFRDALSHLDQKSYRDHLAKYGDIDFSEREDDLGVDVEEADDAIHDLDDRLNAVAPPGAYFGAHPGDGADYGFWLADEE